MYIQIQDQIGAVTQKTNLRELIHSVYLSTGCLGEASERLTHNPPMWATDHFDGV